MDKVEDDIRLIDPKIQARLDAPAEEVFDNLTRLAALSFATPIALVALVDAGRQWLKSSYGLNLRKTSTSVAFCDPVVEEAGDLVVLDATRDQRFCDHPLVTGGLGVRFYAGAPITTPSGLRLGTLCVLDTQPRDAFGEDKQAQLAAMARVVSDALMMRQDIRDLVKLQQQHARDANLLAQAEDLAGLGHWSWDARTNKTDWSPAVYRIHGCSPDQPPPGLEGVLRLYHPEDADRLATLVERAVLYGEAYTLNARIIRPDGQVRHVAAKGHPERDPSGAIVSLSGTFLDVTDLKLADEQLRTNEARLSYLMRESADLIVRLEPEKGITWISPSCRLYGYEPEELIGTFAVDLVHPDDREDVAAVRNARFAGISDSPGITRQFRVCRKDGAWIEFEGNPTLIRGEDGQVIEIVNILRDVTAAKEAQRALDEARRAAEMAAQVKTDFMANMSHEIRTPLTAILGYTRLLSARTDLDGQARSQLARLSQAGEALMAIVNHVLDFSKLEAGQTELEPVPTRIVDLIQDALLMFSPQADAKGLKLEFSAEESVPAYLSIDPERTRQILLNLVGNAVKFTREGQVRLRVSYGICASDLEIWVEDTGPGMTTEQCNQLFKRFSQVDGSSTRDHGGTGLGLAISKGLAELMGGDISVTSQPGVGSVFHLRVPAPIAEADLVSNDSEDVGALLGGVRILVIDDNMINRELARAMLEPFGAEVFDAANGADGLALAMREPVDVILMDMRMPAMDGPEVLARLRASDGVNRDTPTLAFTAEAESLANPSAHGFNGFVGKPIEPAAAVGAIIAALDVASQG